MDCHQIHEHEAPLTLQKLNVWSDTTRPIGPYLRNWRSDSSDYLGRYNINYERVASSVKLGHKGTSTECHRRGVVSSTSNCITRCSIKTHLITVLVLGRKPLISPSPNHPYHSKVIVDLRVPTGE